MVIISCLDSANEKHYYTKKQLPTTSKKSRI